MQARMSQNPVMIVPDALQALQTLRESAEQGAVPSGTIGLVQLRASQINGYSACVEQHCRFLREAGETDERLFAWWPGGMPPTEPLPNAPPWRWPRPSPV